MTGVGGAAELSEADRSAIRETLDELKATPVPVNRGPSGCLVAIVGLLILAVERALPEHPTVDFVRPFILLGGALAIAGGLVSSFFGGSSARTDARAAVEAALRRLEDAESDRDTLVRAATVLVAKSTISTGPSTDQIVSEPEVRDRVAAVRPLLEAVERHMTERFNYVPTFTDVDGNSTEV